VTGSISGDGPTALASAAGAGAGDDADERLVSGARAGDYEIDRFLGAGAMGDVYAGRHPLIGKRVAIKVIKRRLAASPEAASRFLREARAANQVDHPNVVDVFALGRLDDGRLYLVMDLLDGEPLAARLKRGRVAAADALALLAPIAAALDAAHERGVVHRDLKPDNVFVSGPPDEPRVHVLDFGIAKLLAGAGGDAPAALTGEGTWLGTPAYMAPEQWSADGAGPASDRYALGVIAYQMLAGDVPFRAGSLPAMMEKHFRAPVPPLATGAGALPPAVDAVLARALAKDPEARFPSAAALVGALAAALGTARGARAAVSPVASARSDRRHRARAAALVGGGVALVAVAGGAWVIAHDRAAGERAPDDRTDTGGVRVEITSTPAGAHVRRAGRDLGTTPLALDARPGEAIAVEIARPGYLAVLRRATARAGARIDAALAPVRGFEGTWAMQDGTLRAFERRGEQVAAFALDRADAARRLVRMYEFAPAPAGEATFAAEEEHVDERAPDEPSCHILLRAEYHYQPAGDVLELRKERASYDLDGGTCVVHAVAWTDLTPMRRIGERGDAWAEATGAGQVPAPAPQQQQAPEAKDDPVPDVKQLAPSKRNRTLPPPKNAVPQQKAVPLPKAPAPAPQPQLANPPVSNPDDVAPPPTPSQAHQAEQLAPRARN
jgi:tRNA A-37 threonylcarbamoyl transferase component Bud32